jgi:hypothetical protein
VEAQYITYEEDWTFGEGWGHGWGGRTASPIKSPSTQTIYIGQLDAWQAAKVWELCQASVIRGIYFRGDARRAVLILECGSWEKAQEVLGTLPLVKEFNTRRL